MLCEQHFKALAMARKKQEIMLKYVQEARTTYLAVNAVQANDEGPCRCSPNSGQSSQRVGPYHPDATDDIVRRLPYR